MRWIVAFLALVTAGAAAAAAAYVFVLEAEDDPRVESSQATVLPQEAMPGRLLVGFQDDSSFRWSLERAEALDDAREASASVIRTIVNWHDAAPERPANPTDPFDPAYRLQDVDDLARNAQQRGIELLMTIWGTPKWANGGQRPNRPPTDPSDLESFAQALADRYSGRHAGYPAVRLFSAWNEPNLEQFLAPQFDPDGGSVSPALYAPIARAVYEGVKATNPEALVAIGETSPRGHDRPGLLFQDSHSPVRFARLVAEQTPPVPFDAWAQHPYPPRPTVGPTEPARWPRIGIANIERFAESLDLWYGREDIPIWITEYSHETKPPDPLGVSPSLQAQFAEEALSLAAEDPRVRMFLWFVIRDETTAWQSGLLAENGAPKPSFARFAAAARDLDGRNPVLPAPAQVVRLPALELAYSTPAGDPITVTVNGSEATTVPLREDGWVVVRLDTSTGSPNTLEIRLANAHGQVVERNVDLRRTFQAN
jgi:hypothetical protein